MHRFLLHSVCVFFVSVSSQLAIAQSTTTFAIPDTGQINTYGNGREIEHPKSGETWNGQDGQYEINPPQYKDNDDGTVTDLVSGLIWQKTPDFVKRNQDDAEKYADKLELAGHNDWRLPTITELFSIADFQGNMKTRTPYINTEYFDFAYPNSDVGSSGLPGQRNMDGQYASSTRYLGMTMGRDKSAFGFNFADGRIKSYPLNATRYVRCVRGNSNYGIHDFKNNHDGTVTDRATGLIWQTADSGKGMDWKDALAYAENLTLAGEDDWRLPSVKELQSIVDYSRAPDARNKSMRGPAIDPIFKLTTDESWCWSSTTHIENQFAYYVCFGQSFSALKRRGKQINAHGAGAVRSDPKEGDPRRWPNGLGPQSDEIRIFNYVRCVRGGDITPVGNTKESEVSRTNSNNESSTSKDKTKSTSWENIRSQNARKNRTTTTKSNELSVVTVGTGSPLFNPDRSSPCTIVQLDDEKVLVDMGEGTSRQLNLNSIRLKEFTAFCFTHHHRDHNDDAMTILPMAWLRGNDSPIIGPTGTKKLCDFLWDFYAEDLEYRSTNHGKSGKQLNRPEVIELPYKKPLQIGKMNVTFAEVNHTITTFAYRFEANGKSVVVSGDLRYSDNLIALAKDADILVMDSGGVIYSDSSTPKRSGIRQGSSKNNRAGKSRESRKQRGKNTKTAHASLEDVARMAEQSGAKKLVLTHFRPGTVAESETISKMREIYSGKIIFAEDMQTYQ
jgi:ribonuclease BN (tRNA processing enzyme)